MHFDETGAMPCAGCTCSASFVAVTETGTALDAVWFRQAMDALLALNSAADAVREQDQAALDPQFRVEQEELSR